MGSVAAKLYRLCEIYSLPLQLGWSADADPERDTAYHYWRRLELIDTAELAGIFAARRVGPNTAMGRFFANMDLHFAPEQYRGAEVADLGSGYGFMTFWALLGGASVVHSIGDGARIDFINRLYVAAVDRGLLQAGCLHTRAEFFTIADPGLSPSIKPGTLGLVLLTDTLEHITPRLLPALARAAFNDLRPGGRFISRQLNTDSPGTMRKLQGVWSRIEKEILLPQRLRLIEQRFPQRTVIDRQRFAQRARGLDRPDFLQAMDRFALDGSLPAHDPNIAPIDVVLDVPAEGDTSIARIMGEFQRAGFQHRLVYPDVTTSRRSRFLHPLAKHLPRLFLATHMLDEATVFVMRK